MRTLDLTERKVTVEELLRWAMSDSVLIQTKDGHRFIIEETDEFEQEVEMLGSSAKFMEFLEKRSQEDGMMSLDEFEKRLS